MQIVTIERTSKSVKVTRLVCWLLLIWSIFSMVNRGGPEGPGPYLFWLALVGMFVARVVQWWRND